jgi:hypothetical protein
MLQRLKMMDCKSMATPMLKNMKLLSDSSLDFERLKMMDCKSVATPMLKNMKVLSDSSLDFVDPTMYRQLIGSLMYLVRVTS